MPFNAIVFNLCEFFLKKSFGRYLLDMKTKCLCTQQCEIVECPPHRMWMCQQKDNRTGELRDEFIAGVEQFDTFARSHLLIECTVVFVRNAKMLSTSNQMMLNYICTRKDLSKVIGLGQVMGRCMMHNLARVLLLVVGMTQLPCLVATKNLIMTVTTTIIWIQW